MNLYLHYTRQPYPGDDATFDAIPTYATGRFERNHQGQILLAITGNMHTTDRLSTSLLHGQGLLDQLRDADGNPTRLEATGINSDEDAALLTEAQAQGWRAVAAH